jgi:hypothetical protein
LRGCTCCEACGRRWSCWSSRSPPLRGQPRCPLVAISGGTELSRELTTDARAFLGAGPDREARGSGQHLTPVGVFLLVSVPLVVLGGFLLDTRS